MNLGTMPADIQAKLAALTGGADASTDYGMSRVRRWRSFKETENSLVTEQCFVTPAVKFDAKFKYKDPTTTKDVELDAFSVEFSYRLILPENQVFEQDGEPIVLPYVGVNTLPEDKGKGPRIRARMAESRLATSCAALLGLEGNAWKAKFAQSGGWYGIFTAIAAKNDELVKANSGLMAKVEFKIAHTKTTNPTTGETKTYVNGDDIIREVLSS